LLTGGGRAARVGVPETGAGFCFSYRPRSAAGLLKNELADDQQQGRGRRQRTDGESNIA